MSAHLQPVHCAALWNDDALENYDKDQCLVFFYLMTCETPGFSGIFKHTFKRISNHLPVTIDEVKKVFEKGLKNVIFDETTNTFFVKNRLNYCLKIGGRRDLIALNIIRDHKITYTAHALWQQWIEYYSDFISEQSELEKYFEMVKDLVDVRSDTLPAALFTTIKENTVRSVETPNIEDAIQNHLNRYAAELDETACDYVMRVWKHISTSLKTKKPLNERKQLEMLQRLSKEKSIVVGKACSSFIKARAIETDKRFDYLLGIVNKSARSWHIETQAELDKKQFKLEEGE